MFRNPNQRKFLFALDSDKKKGLNPGSVQNLNQPPLIKPIKMSISNVPKLGNPEEKPKAKNISSLPGLEKLPKFGKMKNSLKSQFKGIK